MQAVSEFFEVVLTFSELRVAHRFRLLCIGQVSPAATTDGLSDSLHVQSGVGKTSLIKEVFGLSNVVSDW